MSKDSKQQKNTEVKQLSLFNILMEPVAVSTGGTGTGTVTGVELSSQLERQRILTGNLLEEVVDYGNLH